MRASQALPLLVLLVFGAACGGVRTVSAASQPRPPRTTVEVRNLKPIDFNLYVLSGTHRLRLGTVPGSSSRTFTLPPHLIASGQGTLRFQADPIGSSDVASSEDALLVREGDQLQLTLQ